MNKSRNLKQPPFFIIGCIAIPLLFSCPSASKWIDRVDGLVMSVSAQGHGAQFQKAEPRR